MNKKNHSQVFMKTGIKPNFNMEYLKIDTDSLQISNFILGAFLR